MEEASELDDAFSDIQDGAEAIEEVDTGAFEDVDMSGVEEAADPFAEGLSSPGGTHEATEEIDFSGLSLNSQTAEEDDPFGAPAGDEPADQPAEEIASSGDDAFEQQEDDPSGYEDVEQSPANPQALFEDIQEDAPAAAAVTDEPTIGGSTTIFERISVLKERRALLIGAGAGFAALVLGAGAWFFLGRGDKAGPTAPVAAVATAKVVAAPTLVTQATVAVPATSPTLAAAATQPATPPVAPEAAPLPPVPPKVTQAAVKTKPAISRGPASKVVDVVAAAVGSVVIRGDGAFQKVKHFTMSEPNRIVVDIYGVQKAFKGLSRSGKGAVAKIRPGEHEGKIRFVLDLQKEAGKIPAYELTSDGDGIVVRPGR
jgi:hypothetical protein